MNTPKRVSVCVMERTANVMHDTYIGVGPTTGCQCLTCVLVRNGPEPTPVCPECGLHLDSRVQLYERCNCAT